MSKPETLLQFLDRCKRELSEQKAAPVEPTTMYTTEYCSYIVKTYCKLSTGSDPESREILKFRPFDTIEYHVKRCAKEDDIKIPEKIVVTRSNILDNTCRSLYWSSEKMEDWLRKNCLKQNKKRRHVKR